MISDHLNEIARSEGRRAGLPDQPNDYRAFINQPHSDPPQKNPHIAELQLASFSTLSLVLPSQTPLSFILTRKLYNGT
jgi:hypothetical protein